jgi:hypothetical protein
MALIRLGVVLIVAAAVAGCVASGGQVAPERVTCAAWTNELQPEGREEAAAAVLAQQWQADGATGSPPRELVQRFADAIGNVCRAAPADTVSAVGQRVYATLDEAAPPSSTQARPSMPPAGPELFEPEEPAILEGRSARAEVRNAEVEQFARFYGASGDDVPADDHVFVQLHITYTALTDNVSYAPADWQLFADGLAAGSRARVANGPDPSLEAGVLAKGERASGYVIFEAPATGELILAYAGRTLASAAPYQFVIRDVARPF